MDWDLRRFGEIDSTNRWLLEQARQGVPEGLVAVADHQTAGRGRLGRRWEAPPGASLLLSVLLRPDLPPGRLHLVTAAVALAAVDAVDASAGFRPGLKWPNDLVVDDLKLGGILAEAEPPAVVIGLGLNVNWPSEALLPAATACNTVCGHEVDREQLIAVLLDRLGEQYLEVASVAGRYRAACVTVGRLVRVELADETFTGRAVDIDNDGHLLVDIGACVRTVAAGDVVHLRPQ